MKRIFGVSGMTFFLITSLSGAGSLGSLESEIESLAGEVARAQNERDFLLLTSEKGKNDPALQAKTEALERRKKDLQERMKELNTRPKTKVSDPSEIRVDADLLNTKPDPNDRDDTPRENTPRALTSITSDAPPMRVESPPKEEVILSGEGIKSEITYKKKKKGLASNEPTSETSVSPSDPGLSEIQYSKKKTKSSVKKSE